MRAQADGGLPQPVNPALRFIIGFEIRGDHVIVVISQGARKRTKAGAVVIGKQTKFGAPLPRRGRGEEAMVGLSHQGLSRRRSSTSCALRPKIKILSAPT